MLRKELKKELKMSLYVYPKSAMKETFKRDLHVPKVTYKSDLHINKGADD